MLKIFVFGAMSLLGTGVALKVRAENDTNDSLAMFDMFDPLAKYYTPGQAFHLTEVPIDPIDNRKHVFVLGPESCGTRLMTRIIGSDLGLSFHGHDYAHDDYDSAAVHISLPWGQTCDLSRLPPEPSTEVVQYGGNGHILQPTIGRWNLHVDRLVHYYEQHAMAIEVVVIVRDPEISLASKMKSHCFHRDMAIREQARAYQLIMQSIGSPHVHVVCYEDLVSKPRETLASLRNALGITTPVWHESIYNGNAHYHVAEPYACTEMLRAYNKLCPNSALAKKYSTC